MRILIQRVREASVDIGGERHSAIGAGMLVLTGIEEVTPHYHIIVETRGGMDALIVETELRPEAFRDSFEAMDALRARIAEKLKGTLLVAPEVRLVEPGGIERTTGKAKHVEDLRKK